MPFETPAARAMSFMLAPSKPAVQENRTRSVRDLTAFRTAVIACGRLSLQSLQFHACMPFLTTDRTVRFDFSCNTPRFALSQLKMTEPFGRRLFISGRISQMVDDPNVAEPGAATASRAMTAPAGFPTPATPSSSALAHPPARRGAGRHAKAGQARRPAAICRSGPDPGRARLWRQDCLRLFRRGAVPRLDRRRLCRRLDVDHRRQGDRPHHRGSRRPEPNRPQGRPDRLDRRRRLSERGRFGPGAHRHPGRHGRPLRPPDRRTGRDHRPGRSPGGRRRARR